MSNKIFSISGRVVDRERKQGVPGLRVEAWDKDLIVDDAFGSALTVNNGIFRMAFEESSFRDLFLDREPDLYFNIYSQGELLLTTKDSVMWNVKNQHTDVVIELDKAPAPKGESPFGHTRGNGSHREDVVKQALVTRRADALFKAMSTDFLLREQFVTDPSQVLSEFVHGKNLSQQKATVSNQLIYSVMSNPRLLRWLRDYSVKLGGRQPSREKFILDFSRAVVENGGYHVLLTLVRSSVEKENVFDVDDVLLPVIFGIFTYGDIFASGTEMSTGTYATEQSGTHISGGIFQSGTEMSTGTYATEQSGTHMSGGIFQSGTEMSTGTYATEQSGTHMSGGVINSGYAQVTLEALVQYSTQLRNSGALNVVFLSTMN